MISSIYRFHGHASLKFVYKNGKTVRQGMLALRYALNSQRAQYRLAVVVSKKVSKSAVVRNRIRRRLYECVRILYSSSLPTYDIALLVYDDKFATMPPSQLMSEVEILFKKAAIVGVTDSIYGIVDKKE